MNVKRTNVRPNAFYVPSPVLFFGTRDQQGTPNVSAMSAVGVVCLEPALVAVGVKPSRKSYKNAVSTGEFSLSLPTQDQLRAVDFVGTRKLRNEPQKVALSGLGLVDLDSVRAPGVEGAPILMGCVLTTVLDRALLGEAVPISHHVLIGRMVECQVEEDRIREGEVRLEEIDTLLYFNRYYLRQGAVIDVQRFTDDRARQEEKMHAYRRVV